jgi:hypothetical protein
MLRYGTGVDWCRNVMASGHAVLTRKGKSLPLYRPEIIPVGETVLAALPRPFRFMAPDGGGLGKGGDVTLYYDGKPVGTGRVKRTEPLIYSADEACDVGSDTGSPSSPDYGPTDNKFNGEIDWVQIDIGADSQDHLIKPEDRLTIAMARQ